MFLKDSDPNASKEILLGHSLQVLRPTMHNGPGWRVGLWTQGCSLRCTKRCLSPHLLSPEGGHRFPVQQVVKAIQGVCSTREVEGITVLGGEPTDQAEALAPLLRDVRTLGLSTMLYTGHTLDVLQKADIPGVSALLDATDILVDGPFLEEQYDDYLAWRGSRNQTIHLLSSRYSQEDLEEAFEHQKKGFSIMVRSNGAISLSGFQSRESASAAERFLRQMQAPKKNKEEKD